MSVGYTPPYTFNASEEITSFKLNRAIRQGSNGYFSVVAYGATGNGITDDSPAIQAAVSAAEDAGGGVVYFPSGTFLIGATINLATAGVTLLGGPSAVLLSSTSALGAHVLITASSITLDGLTFDGAYTSGSGVLDISFGLVQIEGRSDVSSITQIDIRGCTLNNSKACAIRLRGNVDGLRVTRNTFSHHFCSMFADAYSTSTTYKNVYIQNNVFNANWGTGSQSGAMKFQGDLTNSLSPTNCVFDNNIVIGTGQMGVEMWKLFTHSTIRNNTFSSVDFCVSVDKGSAVTVVGNKCDQFTYAGIELAVQCTNCLVEANNVNGYTTPAGTTRGGTYGIILSNLTNVGNTITGNVVTGIADTGIFIQTASRTLVEGNTIIDCAVLINDQDSSYLIIRNNNLLGTCGYHIFLNCDSADCTSVDIDSNYFYGNATSDNIILYNAATTHTLTNLRIHNNNAIGATFGNLSINRSMADALIPNAQCYDNYFKAGGSAADFSDFSTGTPAPYSASIQRAGLSIAAHSTVVLPPLAPATWFKVWSSTAYGVSILMQMHIASRGLLDNRSSAMSVFVVAAPYGQSSAVSLFPDGDYNGGIIQSVIYDNPSSGVQQDIWLCLRASTDGGTFDLYFSDYASGVISTPTGVTVEPTWASNSYIGQKDVYRRETNITGLISRQFIGSATRGNIGTLGGRLHIVGEGVASEIGVGAATRIVRFDKQDGTEAFGVDQNGLTLVKLGQKITTLSSGLMFTDSTGVVAAGAGTTAPGTHSLTLSGTINTYGVTSVLMGGPTDWESVVINGTTYKIPLYTT
jgi:parallel beta-helix repeat protein